MSSFLLAKETSLRYIVLEIIDRVQRFQDDLHTASWLLLPFQC